MKGAPSDPAPASPLAELSTRQRTLFLDADKAWSDGERAWHRIMAELRRCCTLDELRAWHIDMEEHERPLAHWRQKAIQYLASQPPPFFMRLARREVEKAESAMAGLKAFYKALFDELDNARVAADARRARRHGSENQKARRLLLDAEIAERLAASRMSARALGKKHGSGGETPIKWKHSCKRGNREVSQSKIEKVISAARRAHPVRG